LLLAANLVHRPYPSPWEALFRRSLRRACYDCHSNETNLRFYDRIVPAYWLVAKHVREGRARLNFSELGAAPVQVQQARLFTSVNQTLLGAMPPKAYTALHRDAVVRADDIAVLERYLQEMVGRPASAGTAAHASPAPEPSRSPQAQAEVAPAPNGLPFFPDYADWKPVSTTDRFDNDSLRVILGNTVAMRAIAEKRPGPWPDGSAFAKISVAKSRTPEGTIKPGALNHVEFMIKDARRYAATSGWGWGRWLGDAHKPYGKDASFVRECTGCHAPMHATDFVFTQPIVAGDSGDRWNAKAALPDTLPVRPLGWRVLSVALDETAGTMSTLYGDDTAIARARSGSPTFDPSGATLALVTWARQPDAHWFGALIPGELRSVEIVRAGLVGALELDYKSYQGPSSREAAVSAEVRARRIDTIVHTATASIGPMAAQ
jgi:hypothetical protein